VVTTGPPPRTTAGPVRSGSGRAAYLFLIPWILGVLLITAVPMIASLYLSFTDYRLGGSPEWVGLANYSRMLTDPAFASSALVTAKYVFISVPLQLAFALLIAVVLNRGVRGLALYRSVYYLPSLLGGSVAVAVLWRQLFASDGLLPQLAGELGITMGSWISDPAHALSTLIVLNVWTFGSPMVIFLAGLRQIPTMYYEAASVDGAGVLRRFFSITLPLLTPIIFFNLVLQIIHAFQSFTQAFVVSGGSGGPSDSTMFFTLYLYDRGFGNFDMGYASAMAWFLLVIIGVFTAANFFASKYWVFYDD
jgi:multiple sugar transport system permease protein